MHALFYSLYLVCGLVLLVYGLHRLTLLWRAWKGRAPEPKPQGSLPQGEYPSVTVQLPIYNERLVVERLLRSVASLDYPKDRLEIQVLDDSDDETSEVVARLATELSQGGLRLVHLRRSQRKGYKAGALQEGLLRTQSELIAIFDADFVPPPHFLKLIVPYFEDPSVGMVQARWDFLNRSEALLTRFQALFLDGHFLVEQPARASMGVFLNFNGTAGVWRRKCIESAGGWCADTLTEDLDLSYRAQFLGWKFLFLPHLAVPSELPYPMPAYRSQQHRWAKGAMQTAQKHLVTLLTGPFSLRVKLEGLFHLLSHAIHPFVACIAFLNLWAAFSAEKASPFAQPFIGSVFLALALCFFPPMGILLAMRRSSLFGYVLLPFYAAASLGMSLANTRSALEGLLDRRAVFIRTPKRGIEISGNPGRALSLYSAPTPWVLPVVETLLGFIFLLASQELLMKKWWLVLPTYLLHAFGFLYVGLLTLYWGVRQETDRRIATALSKRKDR
ncbi:glycosyltransferase [Candidatus Methylacidithermus pantelleriae]|uniref:Glycosyltransferase n=1 Tax=Candidatus Methylacidithermus pantelleriae TaxID=2744239 RepID=A0A8J2FSB7_9BACT|nr:glycosyltransferase [Candidatus Methylacidithermus pantelleriae]CAF0695342.1 Glycosyltransferase [Candidatus Methylacidithermus pantelleriae]